MPGFAQILCKIIPQSWRDGSSSYRESEFCSLNLGTGRLTTFCNSSSKGSNAPGLQESSHTCVHVQKYKTTTITTIAPLPPQKTTLQKTSHARGLAELLTVWKWLECQKQSTDSIQPQSKFLHYLFIKLEKTILKFIWKHENLQIVKDTGSRNSWTHHDTWCKLVL